MTGDSPGQGDGAAGKAAWAEQRRRATAEHAAAMRRAKATEAARATRLVEAFVVRANEHGIPPEPLVARGYTGKGRYRTGLIGWYIHPNRLVAIATDGQYYLLNVPGSALALLKGVTLSPEQPPLVVGAGGRDGESISLFDLLNRRLAAAGAAPLAPVF